MALRPKDWASPNPNGINEGNKDFFWQKVSFFSPEKENQKAVNADRKHIANPK